MLNRENVVSTLRKVIAAHVPRKSRVYNYTVLDGVPRDRNMLGIFPDPRPCEGKVVEILDDFFLVKIKRTAFCVVDKSLATAIPSVGDSVRITPYARRDFDGQHIDTLKKEIRTLLDSSQYSITSVMIGGTTTHLPLPEPKCPELAQLKEQIEMMPAPDGFRKVAHLLVDANAKDFSMVDPKPNNIIKTPPAIRCQVKTTRFEGELAIIYERGSDTYAIELSQADKPIERVDDVYFDELGQRLADLIDDELWLQIKVEVLSCKATRRTH